MAISNRVGSHGKRLARVAAPGRTWAVAVVGELPATDSRVYIIASRSTLPITGNCRVKLYPVNDELSRVAAQSGILHPGDVHALGIVRKGTLMD